MNPFEQGLARAKRRHRLLFVVFASIILIAALGVAGVLIAAGGTRIIVTPEEAVESAKVSVVRGTAVAIDKIIYSLAGTVNIGVTASKFRPVERLLLPEEQGQNVVVKLVPLPATLRGTTTPERENTRWFIDGDLVTVGPDVERELSPGTYTLRIDNPYYQVIEQSIVGKRGGVTEVSPNLIPTEGRLIISTEPADAAILINGEDIGSGPVDITRPGGEYRIAVNKQGFRTVEDTVGLTNTVSEIERRYRLRPLSAFLTVVVEPEGGELLLNGKSVSPGRAYEIDSGVPSQVVYFRAGFKSAKRSVTLTPDENETLRISLEADIGRVDVKSTPSADIYVSGNKVGTTPVTLNLPAVPTEIEFRKDGYRTVRQRITPSGKRTTVVAEALQTERSLRLAEAKPVYTNSIGITLKQFKPTSFTMGAPRSEQGQRANEFLKSVKLEKIFYAALHEVTNDQYRAFNPSHGGQSNQPSDHPAVGMRWIDAAKFTNWLSAKEDLKPFYRIVDNQLAGVNETADGYRLLTEAEWEWLARKAGKASQTIFPWGNQAVVPKNSGNIADESANGIVQFYVPNYVDGYAQLAPVGSFPAEASGLFDLTGNAREWVHDYYALTPPVKGQEFVDPLGPPFGAAHVVKGASWRSGTRSVLRAAYRDGSSAPADDIGFRVGRYLYGGEDAKAN